MTRPLEDYQIANGSRIVLYLQGPKEKLWGILLAMNAAGITIRGIDLGTVEAYMRQEARGDDNALGLVTAFYPMGRVERMELDETLGDILSLGDRFTLEVGRTIEGILGIESED